MDQSKAQGTIIELPTSTVVRLTASSIIGYVLVRSFYGERPGADWDDEQEREETVAFIMRGLGAS